MNTNHVWNVSNVAPHAGAWIETQVGATCYETAEASRPTRARGLKRVDRLG